MNKRGPRGDWPIPMTHAQMVEAARLFFKCEYDTLEIAKKLCVGEHDVWNSMAFIHAVRKVDESYGSDNQTCPER